MSKYEYEYCPEPNSAASGSTMTDRLQTADEVEDLRLTADVRLDRPHRRRLILTFSLFYAELLQKFDDGLHVCIGEWQFGIPNFSMGTSWEWESTKCISRTGMVVGITTIG